jgi:autotransporter passenger strand-loop-strand repeat protein
LLNGGHEILSSGAIVDAAVISSGGTLGVVRGGTASGTTVLSGGREVVSSGGLESAVTLNGSGTLEVSSGGTVGTVDFGSISGGTLQLDSLVAFGGTVSGFTLGDGIDLHSLAFNSNIHLSWSQSTTGPNASGTLTVFSGATSETTLTLLGQYSQTGFGATSATGGGTLITDTVAPSSASQTPLIAHQ